jgi:hypothetical protein
MTFIGCSGGDSSDGGVDYDDLIRTGFLDGREFEIVISTSGRAALTPATGQFYIIRFTDDGSVISGGRIKYDGFYIEFIPDDKDIAPFYGSYSGGALAIANIP